MRVKLLTTAQASNLHKRFDHWFEIQPIPVKNDRWIITEDTGLALKEEMIDRVESTPNLRTKALTIWNAIKDLPIYELDDYPQFLYDHDDETDLAEYTARFADLVFENVTKDDTSLLGTIKSARIFRAVKEVNPYSFIKRWLISIKLFFAKLFKRND